MCLPTPRDSHHSSIVMSTPVFLPGFAPLSTQRYVVFGERQGRRRGWPTSRSTGPAPFAVRPSVLGSRVCCHPTELPHAAPHERANSSGVRWPRELCRCSAWREAKRSVDQQASGNQRAKSGENYRFALDQDRVGDSLSTHGLRPSTGTGRRVSGVRIGMRSWCSYCRPTLRALLLTLGLAQGTVSSILWP
jgi:hypothetical protein